MLAGDTCSRVFGVACGSADEGGGGPGPPRAAQTADLSQFPTPTRSQAAPQPEPTQPVASGRCGSNPGGTEQCDRKANPRKSSQ